MNDEKRKGDERTAMSDMQAEMLGHQQERKACDVSSSLMVVLPRGSCCAVVSPNTGTIDHSYATFV